MRDDKSFMKLALELAGQARGRTSPNPMVGAVIVKGNKIIGEGYHKRAGLEHAEMAALKKAGAGAKGAALYVNLEPCNHFGRTPPCTEAIIKSGIKRVVAAMKDPNPLNDGKGLKRLKRAGIKVETGILEGAARTLNEVFLKYITLRRPFVTVKVAQSLDGKIATKTGDSKWISSEESRRFVHELRQQTDAIMVGANTIIKDNPLLTSRDDGRGAMDESKQPIKIIVDSDLRIPAYSKIFSRQSPAKVILATTPKAPKKKIAQFEKMGCEVLILREKTGRVNLRELMEELGKREIASVIVEGGGELIGSIVEEKLADKFLFFIAPKIIGGKDAISSVEGKGIEKIKQAYVLKSISYEKFGNDLLIIGY